jgi:hypothetical protein
MDEEYRSLVENRTWTVSKPPPNVKPVPAKWMFKIKRDKQGKIERYKARFVAKGFRQKHGVDYEEVFAPVSRHATVRALLAVAASRDLEVEQLDIKTAFLNGTLDEEIYAEQPEGYEPGEPMMKLRLHKSLYGLKQASRQWYLCFARAMEKIGFTTSSADPALFIKHAPRTTFIVIWLDDDLLIGHPEEVQEAKTAISSMFEVRDLGLADFFLGMEITCDRNNRTITLSQKRATQDLIQEFNMQTAKPRPTPLSIAEKPTREGEALDTSTFPYASLVGGLLYIANCTRVDLSHCTGILSRFMSNPTKEHWRLTKAALAYQTGNSSRGITFGTDDLKLRGFCDANLAGDLDTRRSTSGFIFTLGGGAVTWASKCQPTVACSTVEAEYMAAALATKEALWLRKLCADLGIKCNTVHIMCDNQGAIKLSKHAIASQRSKHIDIAHHFIRERTMRREVEFKYISTDLQVADFLTKAVSVDKFETCFAQVGLS